MRPKEKYSSSYVKLPDISAHHHQLSDLIPMGRDTHRDRSLVSIKSSAKILSSLHRKDYTNQYSYLNKYKKIDQFADMEQYFENLYGEKKQARIAKETEKQKENMKASLPSIHDKPTFESEMLKYKLQHLEERLNRMQPLRVIPMVNQEPLCQKCQKNERARQSKQKPTIFAKDKQQRRKLLLRKFRIYGWAAYFCVMFPHYALKFGHLKVERFIKKYLDNGQETKRHMEEEIMKNFKTIPLYDEILDVHNTQEVKKQKKNRKGKKGTISSPQIQSQIIKINNSSQKEFYVNLGVFKKIMQKIMQLIEQVISNFSDEVVEYIGIGATHQGYYTDNNFLTQELPFINFNKFSGAMDLRTEQETAMILSNLFVKRIIMKYLLSLGTESGLKDLFVNTKRMGSNQQFIFGQICKQLEFSAMFLYEVASEMFYGLMITDRGFDGNFQTLPQQSRPLIADSLAFSNITFEQSNSKKKNKEDKKKEFERKKDRLKSAKIIEDHLQRMKSDKGLKISEQQKLKEYGLLVEAEPLNLIHNNAEFRSIAETMIPFFGSQYDQFGKKMAHICQDLRIRIKETRKKQYKELKKEIFQSSMFHSGDIMILQGVEFTRNKQEERKLKFDDKRLKVYLGLIGNNQQRLEAEGRTLNKKYSIFSKKSVVEEVRSSEASETFQSGTSGSIQSQQYSSSLQQNSESESPSQESSYVSWNNLKNRKRN